jgi:hypothetical protein
MDSQLQLDKLAARAAQEVINEQRRVKHLPVANALRNPSSALSIISLAKIQLQLWRDHNLCSADYIDAWDELLKQPMRAAALLEEHSLRAVQMRQNSPFVASVRQFKAMAHAA